MIFYAQSESSLKTGPKHVKNQIFIKNPIFIKIGGLAVLRPRRASSIRHHLKFLGLNILASEEGPLAPPPSSWPPLVAMGSNFDGA